MKDLPPGWEPATLGEIVESLRNGISMKPDAEQGLAILKISAVRPMNLRPEERRYLAPAPEHGAYQLAAGDLLFTRYNGNPSLVGVCAMVPELNEELVYPDKLIRARLKPGFHPPFFELAVNHGASRHWAQSRVRTTAGQCGISGADLKSMPVPVAPLAEQRRIVAEIEKQFTRIDPSCAALKASTQRLDQLISASIIRTCLLSNSDEIRLKPVGSVGDVTLGRQRAPKHHNGPNMRPYLRVANVHEDRIETHDINHMNFTDAEFERYRLVEGDVLLNEGQSLELVGRPAIYRGEIPDCCFQNTLVRFKASPDVIPEYALYVFRAWLRAGDFRKIARWTTTMAHLGAERFAAMRFPSRPKASQQAIVEHLDASLSSIAHLGGEITRASARAARLRQAILKKAFEGKLVPQDPNDEPASILLERTRAARVEAPRDAHHASAKPMPDMRRQQTFPLE